MQAEGYRFKSVALHHKDMISSWEQLHRIVLQSYGIRHTYGGKREIKLKNCKSTTGVDLNLYKYDIKSQLRNICLYIHTNNSIFTIDIQMDLEYNAKWRLYEKFDYDFSGTFEDFVKQINDIM